MSDSVHEQAEIAGAELVFCDSKLDAAVALECARTFATQGVQGSLNFQPVADAAQSICDAGPEDVPVIAIDIAQGDCQTAFMGANNSRAGNVAGEGLGNFMSENFDCEYDAYISLEDLGVGEVNDLRMNGIHDGFESVCGEIHDERVLDAGRQDIALTKFGDTLTAIPDAETIVVVGINDDSVLGALAAARTAGREEQLYITGMGADSTAHCEIHQPELGWRRRVLPGAVRRDRHPLPHRRSQRRRDPRNAPRQPLLRQQRERRRLLRRR